MTSKPKSLLQRIKDHWIYAIAAVVVTSSSVTFGAVQVLIVSPLRDENARLHREIAPSQIRPQPSPARIVEEQHIYRTYEWQWEGENWYGRISLANQNGKKVVTSMRVGELHKKYTDGGETFSFEIGPRILELIEGSFRLDADHLTLDLIVDKKVIHSNVPARQEITGSLEPRLCFAGKVRYEDFAAKTSYFGDMILVDYISRLDERIENWFISESTR